MKVANGICQQINEIVEEKRERARASSAVGQRHRKDGVAISGRGRL